MGLSIIGICGISIRMLNQHEWTLGMMRQEVILGRRVAAGRIVDFVESHIVEILGDFADYQTVRQAVDIVSDLKRIARAE